MKIKSLEREINKLGLEIKEETKTMYDDFTSPSRKKIKITVKKVISSKYTLEYNNDNFWIKKKGVEEQCEGLFVYANDVYKKLNSNIETVGCSSVTKNGQTISGIWCPKIKDIIQLLKT